MKKAVLILFCIVKALMAMEVIDINASGASLNLIDGKVILNKVILKDGDYKLIADDSYHIFTIKNTKVDGQITSYHNDGTLAQRIEFLDEHNTQYKLTGYYQNTHKKQEIFYKDNEEEGISTEYYENGNIEVQRPYKSGTLDGILSVYNENGSKKQDISYKNGKREGRTIIYYENGHHKEEINYKNGTIEGVSIEYYEDGKKYREKHYIDGVIKVWIFCDRDGKCEENMYFRGKQNEK